VASSRRARLHAPSTTRLERRLRGVGTGISTRSCRAYALYVHRELLGQVVRREILGRYRGSNLGILWSLVNPLMMLAHLHLRLLDHLQLRAGGVEGEVTKGEFAVTLFAG
jgi:lipopolysaccharide transport system permease protein